MPWTIALALFLVGCAGGERWFSANREEVLIEGVPYQVDWIRDERGMDFRLFRAENLPKLVDDMTETRRKILAAEIVAKRECGHGQVVIETKTANGPKMDYARIRCGS